MTAILRTAVAGAIACFIAIALSEEGFCHIGHVLNRCDILSGRRSAVFRHGNTEQPSFPGNAYRRSAPCLVVTP
jgi:hypothetical protein